MRTCRPEVSLGDDSTIAMAKRSPALHAGPRAPDGWKSVRQNSPRWLGGQERAAFLLTARSFRTRTGPAGSAGPIGGGVVLVVAGPEDRGRAVGVLDIVGDDPQGGVAGCGGELGRQAVDGQDPAAAVAH